jgi:hypothetical protein
MSDVHQVTVITRNPLGEDDVGNCEIGFYTVDGDILTLTTAEGVALRDEYTGERITAYLDGEHPATIAKRIVGRRYRASQPDDNGFNRPLRYPKITGIA